MPSVRIDQARSASPAAITATPAGPDTGGSQYFITHSPQPHLDGHYTVFARVVRGYDVLDKLVQGDLITRVDPK